MSRLSTLHAHEKDICKAAKVCLGSCVNVSVSLKGDIMSVTPLRKAFVGRTQLQFVGFNIEKMKIGRAHV